jgi:hypothetical protein
MANFKLLLNKDEQLKASELLKRTKSLDKSTQKYLYGFLVGVALAKEKD